MKRVLLGCCLVLCFAAGASATTLMGFSLRELAARSDVIVVGTPGSSQSEWRGKVIHTITRVRVDQILKGTAPVELPVLQLGGRVGRETMPVSGTTDFSGNGRFLLFLKRAGNGEYVLSGMSQGALRSLPDGRFESFPTAPLWRRGELTEPVPQVHSLEDVRAAIGGGR